MNKTFLATLIFIVLSISRLTAQTVNFDWARQMNSAKSLAISTDAMGNVFTTGFFAGTVDFDPGPGTYSISSSMYDVFISKLDAAGNFLWARSMGGSFSDFGHSIVTDPLGNVYTTGRFSDTVDFDPGVATFTLGSVGNEDVFISKLDAAGNFLWAKSLGGSSADYSNSITIDQVGNVYTTGFFSGTVDFDPGAATFTLIAAADVFILKLDANGNFIWAKNFGGIGLDFGNSIAVDGFGNVYTTGSFRDTADFDPNGGTYTLTATTASIVTSDIFISKLDAAGNFVWAKGIGVASSGGVTPPSLTVDASGKLYCVGSYSGTIDFDPGSGIFNLISSYYDIFILKLDASGNFLWAKNIGGINWDEARSVALDASSNIYTTGLYRDIVDFDPGTSSYTLSSYNASTDLFISKFDANGNFIWAKGIGGKNPDIGNSITVDAAGSIYTTGLFADTVDFDPGVATFTLAGNGSFIHKMSQEGIGINENVVSENTIMVFPNPTSGQFTLINQTKNATVKLFDVTGRVVFEMENIISNQFIIDISEQPSGIYFIEMISEEGVSRSKLVKK